MANAPLPWSLKGVSRTARDAARAAAKREGVPLGVWLSRVIRDISAAERSASAVQGSDAGPGAEAQSESAMNSIERAAARTGLPAADPSPR